MLENKNSLTYKLKNDSEVNALISRADKNLGVIGYTYHGLDHVTRVSKRAAFIVEKLGFPKDVAEIAAVSGLLHDIGNSVNRDGHAQSGAVLAYQILSRHNVPYTTMAEIAAAIGGHDDSNGYPVSVPSAALIIADKSDVLKGRVRPAADLNADIHDRVNFAAKKTEIYVDSTKKNIKLSLTIDVNICPIMDYFEIFLSRMLMCKKSAGFLGCEFRLVINKTRLL